MTASAPAHARVLVFARVPRLGRVKTRLARTIGDSAALAVHRALLAQALQTAAMACPGSLELCIDGVDVDGECARLARLHGASLAVQRGDTLGERMHEALERAIGAGAAPVLIGSDVASLAPDDLRAAFEALAAHDMVFAPAQDGGYGLVGCRRRVPLAVFEPIPWGSARVMAATRARLRACGIDWRELRGVWDVDDAADLARWRAMNASVFQSQPPQAPPRETPGPR